MYCLVIFLPNLSKRSSLFGLFFLARTSQWLLHWFGCIHRSTHLKFNWISSGNRQIMGEINFQTNTYQMVTPHGDNVCSTTLKAAYKLRSKNMFCRLIHRFIASKTYTMAKSSKFNVESCWLKGEDDDAAASDVDDVKKDGILRLCCSMSTFIMCNTIRVTIMKCLSLTNRQQFQSLRPFAKHMHIAHPLSGCVRARKTIMRWGLKRKIQTSQHSGLRRRWDVVIFPLNYPKTTNLLALFACVWVPCNSSGMLPVRQMYIKWVNLTKMTDLINCAGRVNDCHSPLIFAKALYVH